jgi:hypothetical protein
MPEQMRLGQEAVMYVGVAGTTAATEAGYVQSNSPSLTNNEVGGNFRNSRLTNNRAGQGNFKGSVTVQRALTDAAYKMLRYAAVNGTPIALKLIPILGSSEEIVDMDVVITKWDFPEEMDSAQVASFDYAQNRASRDPVFTLGT